jgi:hypothetical protein
MGISLVWMAAQRSCAADLSSQFAMNAPDPV